MNAGSWGNFRPSLSLAVRAVVVVAALLIQPAIGSAQDQENLIPLSQLDSLSVNPDPQDRYVAIVKALDENGYTIMNVRQTILNRALIRARNQYHLREIVVSRASGQVLRDVIIEDFAPTDQDGHNTIPLDQIIESYEGGIRILTQ